MYFSSIIIIYGFITSYSGFLGRYCATERGLDGSRAHNASSVDNQFKHSHNPLFIRLTNRRVAIVLRAGDVYVDCIELCVDPQKIHVKHSLITGI